MWMIRFSKRRHLQSGVVIKSGGTIHMTAAYIKMPAAEPPPARPAGGRDGGGGGGGMSAGGGGGNSHVFDGGRFHVLDGGAGTAGGGVGGPVRRVSGTAAPIGGPAARPGRISRGCGHEAAAEVAGRLGPAWSGPAAAGRLLLHVAMGVDGRGG